MLRAWTAFDSSAAGIYRVQQRGDAMSEERDWLWRSAGRAAERGDCLGAMALFRAGAEVDGSEVVHAKEDSGMKDSIDADTHALSTENRDVRTAALSYSTRLSGIIESLITGEPRTDCVRGLQRLARELEQLGKPQWQCDDCLGWQGIQEEHCHRCGRPRQGG